MAIFISGVGYSVNPSPLAATEGGTGQSVYAVGDILYANTTTTLSKLSVGTNGDVLTLAGGVPTWAAGGGGGSPGGATTNIQYNNAGSFAGDADFVFNASTNTVSLGSSSVAGIIEGLSGGLTGTGGLTVRAGSPSSGTGGQMLIAGADTASAAAAGDTQVRGGFNSVSGDAGSTYISGGDQTGATGTGLSGNLLLRGGNHAAYGSLALNGGNVTVEGGAGANGASVGGIVYINGGIVTSGSGTGGAVIIQTAPNTTRIERFRINPNGSWSVGTGGAAYGTSGQVLTSNGNAAPTWQTPGGGTPATIATSTTIGTTANVPISLTAIAGTSSAGTFSIIGSAASSANNGGAVVIRSGDTASTGLAGNVTVHADSIYRGGDVTVRGGDGAANGSPGSTQAGGHLVLRGGNSTNGSWAGVPGNVTISGGQAGPSSTQTTNGGNIIINGGVGQSGTAGGYLVFSTAATTTLTERFRILPNGAWSVGTGGAAYGTSGQFLKSTGASTPPVWDTVSAAPAGSNTWIQYNNSGVLGADVGFLWTTGTRTLTVGSATTAPSGGTIKAPNSGTVAYSALTIIAGDSTSNSISGGTLTLKGGAAPSGGGPIGPVVIQGGAPGTSGDNGGDISLLASNSGSNGGSREPGDIIVTAGNALGSAAGGSVSITPGSSVSGSAGNVSIGRASLATTATGGFPYFPTCAGTPTGTPTSITGFAPVVIDSTNNKMYFYSGGSWVALN